MKKYSVRVEFGHEEVAGIDILAKDDESARIAANLLFHGPMSDAQIRVKEIKEV